MNVNMKKEWPMKHDGNGNIRIKTYMADEALPVSDTLVKIYGTDDYNKDIKYSFITDSNGVTEEISLPAPNISYSTSPGAEEYPYAVYNVELAKDGFYPKRIDNVPIFSDRSALLPIEMIPLSYNADGAVIPNNNLNSTIYENDKL